MTTDSQAIQTALLTAPANRARNLRAEQRAATVAYVTCGVVLLALACGVLAVLAYVP